MTEEERTDELTQKAKESYRIYSEDKCIDSYEGYQYIDGYCNGYEQGYEDCRHYAHDYYKPKWHDARKEDDFPEDKRKGDFFYCKLKDETCDVEWYEILMWDIEYQTEDIYQIPIASMFISLKTGEDMSDYVIAWCELPRFEE